MDSAALVQIIACYCRIFDNLYVRWLARFLVVLDPALCQSHVSKKVGHDLRLAYLEVQRPSKNICQMSEKLRLEDTIDEGIWFLW